MMPYPRAFLNPYDPMGVFKFIIGEKVQVSVTETGKVVDRFCDAQGESYYQVEVRDMRLLFHEPNLHKAGAVEAPCPIPSCGRMNSIGVRTCWNCGNRVT